MNDWLHLYSTLLTIWVSNDHTNQEVSYRIPDTEISHKEDHHLALSKTYSSQRRWSDYGAKSKQKTQKEKFNTDWREGEEVGRRRRMAKASTGNEVTLVLWFSKGGGLLYETRFLYFLFYLFIYWHMVKFTKWSA